MAVGSAEAFRANCNVMGVTAVAIRVETVSVGTLVKTRPDDVAEVTWCAGLITFLLSCEMGEGGSVAIVLGTSTVCEPYLGRLLRGTRGQCLALSGLGFHGDGLILLLSVIGRICVKTGVPRTPMCWLVVIL